MAFTLINDTSLKSGAASPASVTGVGLINVGDLIIFSALLIDASGTASFGAISDNAGSGAPWTPFPQGPLAISATEIGQCWYKVANAADHTSLTSVSVVLNGTVSAWNAGLLSFRGFTHTATVDFTSTAPSGGSVSTLTATATGTQKAASEVTFGIVFASASTGGPTGSNFYSPDGGATQYALTAATATGGGFWGFWALPTTGGASPEWVWTWVVPRAAQAMALTFYDFTPPTNQGNMLLVMGNV